MFTLHIDLHLRLIPPMRERGACIALTRPIELPFPPLKGLSVHSATMDQCPKPEGLGLADVVWDIEPNGFLAKPELTDVGTPVGAIVSEIQDWLDRGWSWGSCRDTYSEIATRPAARRRRRRKARVNWEQLNRMQ